MSTAGRTLVCLGATIATVAAAAATDAPGLAAQRPLVTFADLSAPPFRFETRLPATAAFVPGPGEGERAVAVTVPTLDQDEKACAFSLALPPLGEGPNGLGLWVRGSDTTRHLEIALRSPAGTYGADVAIGPEWRRVLLGPHNTQPLLGTTGGQLRLADVTGLRFCFGTWQGHTGGPHTVSIGPVSAVQSPAMAAPVPPRTVSAAGVEVPPQPFTVELLDLARGQWEFVDALGQRLALAGPLVAYADAAGQAAPVSLAYLCCDPEFPDDPAHATLRLVDPVHDDGATTWFRLDEPYLAATLTVRRPVAGLAACELSDLRLGPPTPGDAYVAALYLRLADGRDRPLWLAPGREARLKFTTRRVGHVFVDPEPVQLLLSCLNRTPAPAAEVALEITDYARGDVVWRGQAQVPAATAPGLATLPVTVPLSRCGIFAVCARLGDQEARLRVCRLPPLATVDPDASTIGMNLFQQQVWWYAYQVPLMARAGVHWLRPWLAWENTWSLQQPTPQAWDTRALDAALRRMQLHGQRYQTILFAAPAWARGGLGGPAPGSDTESLAAWSAYVERLVAQYKGRIRCYEVWNEPDLMWPESTRHQGEHYVALQKAAWTAAKRADPDCQVLGLSHAGYEEWLDRVGRLGAGDTMDIATIHTYAAPHDFLSHVERRRDLLRRYGYGDKPLWINELGTSAYDFSPAYSEHYRVSERRQAATLVANYALALSVDPRMKAFWFCTYDPRDPAHREGWTSDAGIGVLYLGFLPKLAYAALAGVARQLDGRRCLGRARAGRARQQVSFEGPVAVVWDDAAEDASAAQPVAATVPATEIGCAPAEPIRVLDAFTNELAAGPAAEVRLDLSRGPLYIEGSARLATVAAAEVACRLVPATVALTAGGAAEVEVQVPVWAVLSAAVSPGLPVEANLAPRSSPGDTKQRLTVRAAAGVERAAGTVRVSGQLIPPSSGPGPVVPVELQRELAVSVGAPNLVRSPGFAPGAHLEWVPERASVYACDDRVGHTQPGSLRLDAPFDRRLVHWDTPVKPGAAVYLRVWARTDQLEGAEATVVLSFFGPDKWLTSWCLAANRPAAEIANAWHPVPELGRLPNGTADWTLVQATLPADLIPATTTKVALFVDAAGGGQGHLWLDDIDLWQPPPPP